MNQQADILAIGDVVIDFLPGNRTDEYICRAGGAPANMAIAFARMGGKAAFCGKVGDDLFGRRLVALLEKQGLQVCPVEPAHESVTTMTIVSLDDTGNRSFTFAQKQGAHLFLSPDEISEKMIQDVEIVHSSSTMLYGGTSPNAVYKAFQTAKRLNKTVSFDLNYRSATWAKPEDCAAAVENLLPYIDLLKLSNEEVFLVGGEKALPQLMEQFQIPLVVLTRGAGPSSVYYGGKQWSCPQVRSKIVDTTGAGDAFWGVFLYKLHAGAKDSENSFNLTALNENTVKEALVWANAAGELTTQKKGAIDALPTRRQVEEAVPLYELQ